MGKTAETTAERQKIEQAVAAAGEAARRVGPMTGSITNTVTVNFVANAQLAVGGSAAMVYLPDEAEAIARAGGATYINVGTLLPVYAQTVPAVTKTLNALDRPWVLDPVAIGIGALRTELLAGMKPYKPAIIRGNASEIIALAGLWGLDGGAAHWRGGGRLREDGSGDGRPGGGPFPRRLADDGPGHRMRLLPGRGRGGLCGGGRTLCGGPCGDGGL